MLNPAVSLGKMRPETFEDFRGYEPQKRSLKTSLIALSKDIDVAKKIDLESNRDRKEWDSAYYVSSDHVLIYGMPGCGKTTLAEIYAMERSRMAVENDWPIWMMGDSKDKGVERWTGGRPDRPFRWSVVEGRMLKTEVDIDRYLCYLQAYGTLIIDEFQEVDDKAMSVLYSFLHEGEWYSHTRKATVRAWGFNVVATTTNDESIPDPIKSRFLTKISLDSYSKEDMRMMVEKACSDMGVVVDDDSVIDMIVERGRDYPRSVISFLSNVRTYLRAYGDSNVINKDIVREASLGNEVGPLGLTRFDARVMLYLLNNRHIGAIGVDTLASVSKCSGPKGFHSRARFLVMRGYIAPVSGKGTQLLEAGEKALVTAMSDPDFIIIDPDRAGKG